MAKRATPTAVPHRAIEDGLSLLAGIGAGAALMYLLDPQSGRNRRRMIVDSARQSISQASHSVVDAGQHLADRARGGAAHLADEATERARQAGSAAEAFAGEKASHLRDYARSWIPQRFADQNDHPVARTAGLTTGAVGFLVLGAGVAYLFDPDRGRSRREYLRRQITGKAHEATDYVRRTSEHAMNRARGYKARATSAVQEVQENVEEAAESAMNEM